MSQQIFYLICHYTCLENMHNLHGELLSNIKEQYLHEFTSEEYTTFFGTEFLLNVCQRVVKEFNMSSVVLFRF